MNFVNILGTKVSVTSYAESIDLIHRWASAHESRVVAICNVHSIVTARSSIEHSHSLSKADLITPDGAPIAWLMRRLGVKRQTRVNGPDLMWRYLEHAQDVSESVFLYGGAPDTLMRLQDAIHVRYPRLNIAGAYSPPFRSLSAEESTAIVARINGSGAGTVWVSLGCPKQEKWMADNKGHIRSVMIGVGAAFDYHAGTITRAPLWMQNSGLEWLHRLSSEPRRLWKRYLITNSLFVFYASWTIFCRLFGRKGSGN